MIQKKAMLLDTTMCIGCNQCQAACKEANHLSDKEETQLSPSAYTALEKHQLPMTAFSANEDHVAYVRRMCQHCQDPTCASVCPVGALQKSPEGPVTYDEDKCIGCRYCMQSCPFQVPRYNWDSTNPRIFKCIFCKDRLKQGLPTACSEACPTGATKFGYRDDLILEAYARMKAEPARYVDKIYGQEEVGGTSILYLSSVPFEQMGFNTTLQKTPLPALTWNVLSKIPDIVTLGGAFLYGVYWITNRRHEVKEYEEKMKHKDNNN